MNRDEARAYFNTKDLSYKDITLIELRRLANIMESELIRYYKNGGDHARQMNMSVSKLNKENYSFKDGTLVYGKIEIDGSYFSGREGITFSSSGYIGFGTEFSDKNVKPIIRSFKRWCNMISLEKQNSTLVFSDNYDELEKIMNRHEAIVDKIANLFLKL